MNKFHAKKTIVDGIQFDSKKEAQRYQQLKLMVRAGVIRNLDMQVKYTLVPAQYIDGKCVERAVTYYRIHHQAEIDAGEIRHTTP